MSQKILITGSSSGFGKLMAKTLLEKGHTVVASMRGVNGKNRDTAAELAEWGAHVVEIDVTDDAGVQVGVSRAVEKAGGLDVVVNNAGVGVSGVQEAFTADDWKKLFEINVFGVQRVTRAVLPRFREQKSGLVVFVSSLLGRITLPFYGPYNASKWAVEAMAENYRAELSGFGIDVAVIEPGGFPTEFMTNLMQPSDTDRMEEYGELSAAAQTMGESFGKVLAANPQQNPQIIADKLLELVKLEAGNRPFRNPVDKIGMGDPIVEYNGHLEKIMQALYNNFGMGDMLK